MSRSPDHAVYVISVAAELAGVHPQTLRIYERKGLVDPARTQGGSRRYSDADIDLLKRIQDLTNAGLNLAGVERVLALEEQLERTQRKVDALERRRTQLEADISRLEAVRREVRAELIPYKQFADALKPPSARTATD